MKPHPKWLLGAGESPTHWGTRMPVSQLLDKNSLPSVYACVCVCVCGTEQSGGEGRGREGKGGEGRGREGRGSDKQVTGTKERV